jgi:hypothetical protein
MGEAGVGISTQPDSVEQAGEPTRSCPGRKTAGENRFYVYVIPTQGDEWIDLDIDLLIDEQFGTNQLVNAVTSDEANLLLQALDREHENRFDWPLTDLAMAYQYFAKSEPYDSLGEDRRFALFPICTDPEMASEIGHLDLYLTPAATWQEIQNSTIYSCGGRYTSGCTDTDEDPAATEWPWNSVSVTDNFGNRGSDQTDWPLVAALGAVHEFTHACWQSNYDSYGSHGGDYWSGDYNELLACSSEYLGKPPSANLGGDLRYIYSVLNDYSALCKDPCKGEDVRAQDQRYHLWRLFGAYLGYQFNDPDTLQNALISRWARNETTWPNSNTGMERTFCGLARVLNDAQYDSLLGHDTGAERVSQLFANYGIARWVDYPILPSGNPQVYDFGPDFSAYDDAGQFNKHDNDPEWAYNALWEYVMPPEFILDGDNVGVWTSYPAPCHAGAPPESVGWRDTFRQHNPVSTGIYHGCVPVQVDLWGSNYLVFRADTLAFGLSAVDTLVVDFDWVDATGDTLLNPRAELWLSVLRYKSSVPNLFLKGNRMRLPVDTQLYHRSVGGATVRVPAFKRNQNEAVVVVLTLVPRSYAVGPGGSSTCMTRASFTGELCVDLRYSYRFRVMAGDPEPPGGGCPFVSSLGASGYASDNNVLAPAWAGGDDVLDTYLLKQRPTAIDGTYRLRLTETEDERSRFDGVELLAIDHAAGTNAAVFADGTIGSYKVTGQPVACRDQDGDDVLDLVLRSDGENATVKAGGWLDVVFRSEGATRSGGGIGEDGGPGQKIEQPGRGDDGDGTLSLASQCYRANPCVSILDMPEGVTPEDGLITLRVTAPTDYKLDRLFMVERSEDPLTITQCGLSSAHYASQASSCMSALVAEDGVYASLAKGDTIDLAFAAPKTAGEVRDFVLVTRGGEVSRGSEGEGQQPEAAVATISPAISPNPFNPSTAISFNVPGTGGRVAVSIYNMAGRLVRQLADTEMPAGPQTLTWDGLGEHGESLASGVYFCRIEVPGQSDQKKLVLLK